MARTRRVVWLLVALVALAQASLAKAGGPPHANNWEPAGPVLGGVDVVAYHGLGETQTAVMGREQHAYRLPSSGYNYTFYFSTAANRDEFARDPWRYAPRLGGFCLYGMANEWNERECPGNGGPEELADLVMVCGNRNVYGCSCSWPWTREVVGPPAGVHYGWFIYKGRLYLNVYRTYTEVVLTDADVYIARAEARWMHYFGSLQAGPFNTRCWPDNWETCTEGHGHHHHPAEESEQAPPTPPSFPDIVETSTSTTPAPADQFVIGSAAPTDPAKSAGAAAGSLGAALALGAALGVPAAALST